MCLAITAKIVSVSRDQHAVVSFNGVRKKINISLVTSAKCGDWVAVHAGFAISKLTAADASKNLEILNEYVSKKRDYRTS
jgi:hydrogenase expression/formation protein HypC